MTSTRANAFMAIFIGVIMLGSMVGFAFMQQGKQGMMDRPQVTYPDVIEEELAPEEKVDIIRRGMSIIEFSYHGNCSDSCEDRREMYASFAESGDFSNFVLLSVFSTENETVERMTMVNGDLVDLSDVENTLQLRALFCNKSPYKPDVCLLEEV